MQNNKKIIPLLCLLAYLLVTIWSGIRPLVWDVRLVEILTSAIPVLILVIMYMRWIRFSNTAYILMSILPIMHAIWAHYTFANVPSQRLSDILWTSRNMYDRIAHASVGLYAYGIIELLHNQKNSNSRRLTYSYALFAIMSLAATYELFEWWYAVSSDPEAGLAVLGSQGDIWDAQKDILMDTIGGVIGIILYSINNWCTLSKKD